MDWRELPAYVVGGLALVAAVVLEISSCARSKAPAAEGYEALPGSANAYVVKRFPGWMRRLPPSLLAVVHIGCAATDGFAGAWERMAAELCLSALSLAAVRVDAAATKLLHDGARFFLPRRVLAAALCSLAAQGGHLWMSWSSLPVWLHAGCAFAASLGLLLAARSCFSGVPARRFARKAPNSSNEQLRDLDAAAHASYSISDRLPDERSSGFLSWISFHWLSPTIAAGYQRQLQQEDIPLLYDEDQAIVCAERFARLARSRGLHFCVDPVSPEDELRGGAAAGEGAADSRFEAFRDLIFAFVRPHFYEQAFWEITARLAVFLSPLGLHGVVSYLEGCDSEQCSSVPSRAAALSVVLLFLGPALTALGDSQRFNVGRRMGIRVRAAMVSCIFSKALRLDMAASEYSAGEVANLMSVDAQNCMEFFPYANALWTTPVQAVVMVAAIFYVLGAAAAGGFAYFLLTAPLMHYLMRLLKKRNAMYMEAKDRRMGLVNEVLQGIRVIKLFGWEFPYLDRIRGKRAEELSQLRVFLYAWAGVVILVATTGTAVGACSFALQVAGFGRPISAAQAFTSLALFNLLSFPMAIWSWVLNQYILMRTSLRRIEAFLRRPEVRQRPRALPPPLLDGDGETAPASGAGEAAEADGGAGGRAGRDADPFLRVAGEVSEEARAAAVDGSISVRGATFAWSAPPPAAGAERPPAEGGGERPAARGGRDELTAPLLEEGEESKEGPERDPAAGEGGGRIPGVGGAASRLGEGPPALRDVTLEARPGTLTVVCGPIGCGKSTLLQALLGDVACTSGGAVVRGRVAYCAQKSWIQHATLRENILFGLPFDAERYAAAVAAAALGRDLEILPAGDETEIGERGVNLSGGQQQRVALARALYAGASVCLLDDPLSAVDAHVGEHMMREAILGLRDGRFARHGARPCVVLCTHQVQLAVPLADHVLVLSADGSVARQGPPSSISVESLFASLREPGARAAAGPDATAAAGPDPSAAAAPPAGAAEKARGGGGAAGGRKLVEEEKRQRGRITLRTYLDYFEACGGARAALLTLLLFAGTQACTLLSSYALAAWIRAMDRDFSNGGGAGKSLGAEARLYLLLSGGGVALLLLRYLCATSFSLRAARAIHESMALRVVRAPASWHDATPLGRAMNRFSSDVETIDNGTFNQIGYVLDGTLSILATLLVVSAADARVAPLFLPLAAVSLHFSRRYAASARELKRLEATAKSPMYAHFSEAVQGVSTLRAFAGAPERSAAALLRLCDAANASNYSMWSVNRWLNLRLGLSGAAGAAAFGLAAACSAGGLGGASAGLALTYVLQLSSAALDLVRNFAQLEMAMNAVERTSEYRRMDAEAALRSAAPPPEWAKGAALRLERVVLRYRRDLPPVLDGLSLSAAAGERVGVVGRTGAGKSSLLAALFRMVEPEGGGISLGGVDLLGLGLHEARRAMAVVPQDPQLFSGSVRSNLDPFGAAEDAQLWDALRACALDGAVRRMDGGLDARVGGGGGNLSVGERQLLCMARAAVVEAPLLVLDEATASVDPDTDRAIQRTLRSERFRGVTVIAVAHRLSTIIDYDKVLVMSEGRAAEFGPPEELRRIPGGIFRSMCEAQGI